MLLEDLLLVLAIGVVALVLGLPIWRILQSASWRRKDPLAEAQERLRIAKLEVEAARLNRETEKIYEALYEETLKDKPAAGTRIGASEEKARAAESEEREPVESKLEKGKTS